MTQEALKLALEALERASKIMDADAQQFQDNAIEAGKQAIAELESQEPWCMKMNGCRTKCEDCPEKVPQRTWVGLASEDRLTAKYMQDAPDGIEAVIDYIEAKLKEKNT
jgi:hypothetical protein